MVCMNNIANRMLIRVAVALYLAVVCRLYAQEALSDALPSPADTIAQPIPESAWLDLRQNAARNSKTQNAPAWVEALTLFASQATENGNTPKSIFRIRVTQPSPDYRVLFFRLFFDDKPEQRPELIVWDESGTQVLRSGELGSGIDLPSSDAVMIPMRSTTIINSINVKPAFPPSIGRISLISAVLPIADIGAFALAAIRSVGASGPKVKAG